MSIDINKNFTPRFKKDLKPRVGLIALSTDQTIEKDFNNIYKNLSIDIFVNRIHNQNPLTTENLLKMQDDLESVSNKILPNEKVNTIAYGCTSGTIITGYDNIKKKINIAKPDALVTAPSTAALHALKKKNVNKIKLKHLNYIHFFI